VDREERDPNQVYDSRLLKLKPGDIVTVHRDSGPLEEREVKQEPWQLGGGHWVIGLHGISGGFLLNRCSVKVIKNRGHL
jgi:hypothetical protein